MSSSAMITPRMPTKATPKPPGRGRKQGNSSTRNANSNKDASQPGSPKSRKRSLFAEDRLYEEAIISQADLASSTRQRAKPTRAPPIVVAGAVTFEDDEEVEEMMVMIQRLQKMQDGLDESVMSQSQIGSPKSKQGMKSPTAAVAKGEPKSPAKLDPMNPKWSHLMKTRAKRNKTVGEALAEFRNQTKIIRSTGPVADGNGLPAAERHDVMMNHVPAPQPPPTPPPTPPTSIPDELADGEEEVEKEESMYAEEEGGDTIKVVASSKGPTTIDGPVHTLMPLHLKRDRGESTAHAGSAAAIKSSRKNSPARHEEAPLSFLPPINNKKWSEGEANAEGVRSKVVDYSLGLIAEKQENRSEFKKFMIDPALLSSVAPPSVPPISTGAQAVVVKSKKAVSSNSSALTKHGRGTFFSAHEAKRIEREQRVQQRQVQATKAGTGSEWHDAECDTVVTLRQDIVAKRRLATVYRYGKPVVPLTTTASGALLHPGQAGPTLSARFKEPDTEVASSGARTARNFLAVELKELSGYALRDSDRRPQDGVPVGLTDQGLPVNSLLGDRLFSPTLASLKGRGLSRGRAEQEQGSVGGRRGQRQKDGGNAERAQPTTTGSMSGSMSGNTAGSPSGPASPNSTGLPRDGGAQGFNGTGYVGRQLVKRALGLADHSLSAITASENRRMVRKNEAEAARRMREYRKTVVDTVAVHPRELEEERRAKIQQNKENQNQRFADAGIHVEADKNLGAILMELSYNQSVNQQNGDDSGSDSGGRRGKGLPKYRRYSADLEIGNKKITNNDVSESDVSGSDDDDAEDQNADSLEI